MQKALLGYEEIELTGKQTYQDIILIFNSDVDLVRSEWKSKTRR